MNVCKSVIVLNHLQVVGHKALEVDSMVTLVGSKLDTVVEAGEDHKEVHVVACRLAALALLGEPGRE
jgi:hypothetical protein